LPRVVQRDGITWARPWLDGSRDAIDAYVRRYRLRHVDDPSNADLRFARGRLRALWPALHASFADAETTLARAAQRAAADAALVAEVAEQTLRDLLGAHDKSVEGALPVAPWLQLSAARRVAALRLWLANVLPQPAPETLVRRLMDELHGRRQARWHAGGNLDLVLRGGLLAPAAAAKRRP
jgi:tRNA(Ile)-lysidine synthase